MGKSFSLKASKGTHVTEHPLDKPNTTIGRSADNTIVLEDPQVSRHHARVEFDGETTRITDLGSSNGTLINGEKIEPNIPHELKAGDSIGLGSYTFNVQASSPAASSTSSMVKEQPVSASSIPAAAPVKKGILRGKALAGLVAAVVVVAVAAALLLTPGVVRNVLIEHTAHVEIDTSGLRDLIEDIDLSGKTSEQGPMIASFSASSEVVKPGESTVLSWIVPEGTQVNIEPGVGNFTGSGTAEISPDSTKTYIITATNSKGSVTKSVTVEIATDTPAESPDLPIIKAFSASDTSISEGENTILDWDVSGADSISIDPGAPSIPASGSATSSPSDTTTYTLTATNDAGSVTETVTVTVTATSSPPAPVALPSILEFSADPTVVTLGGNAILMWNVYGASSIYIDNGIGQIPFSSGYIVVSPSGSRTYTLTASNSAGSVSASTGITVSAPSLPVVNSFTVNPAGITAGGSTTISWNVSGATYVTIVPGGGSVPSSGSATASPSATTTYTLTASNAAGSVTRQVTVTVAAAAPSLPVIASFTASPTSITAGASSTLSWSISGATSASISPGGGIGASGSASVTPGSTTTYTLTASNAAGSVTRQVTVTVAAAAPSLPVIASFTASPTSITAGASSTLSWSISGATSASISPGGGIGASGSASVTPGSTTTYTLTASNAAGSVTRQVTITVAAAAPPAPADTASCEQALFNAVNAKRSAAGAAPLTRNSYIDSLCRQHAQYMAAAGALSHDNFDSRSAQITANVPGMMSTAENVLDNFAPCDAAAMAQQWYDSSGHRTNMLNPAYTTAGMGIYIDGTGKIWACQIFAGP